MKRHGNTRRRANELVELVCIEVCCYFGAVKSQAKLAKKSSIKIKSSKLDVEVVGLNLWVEEKSFENSFHIFVCCRFSNRYPTYHTARQCTFFI